MNYARTISEEVKKVAQMPTRINKIRLLFEQIEEMKRSILLAEYNSNLSYGERTQSVQELKQALFLAEHLALKLIQEEIEPTKSTEGNGDDT